MKVTMEYIAKMANVSKATVSRVMNNKREGVGEETRKRVLQVIEEYRYDGNQTESRPAVPKGYHKTIGVLIPDITNPFFAEMVKAIDTYAVALGYIIFLCNTDSSTVKEKRCIMTLVAQNVDGVILVPASGGPNSGCAILKKYGIPYVVLDRKVESPEAYPSVYLDNEYAMFRATDYLIRNGNRDIAIFLGPSDLSASEERLEGYKSALKHHGISFDDRLVFSGDFTFQHGYHSTLLLSDSDRWFSAILASSDMIAIGALKALSALNLRVPDDIEVVGFDNIPMSEQVDPPLTTLEQPVKELGSKAAEMMIEIIENGEARSNHVRLEAKLLIRQSTKHNRK